MEEQSNENEKEPKILLPKINTTRNFQINDPSSVSHILKIIIRAKH